jgi:hypothetical protein
MKKFQGFVVLADTLAIPIWSVAQVSTMKRSSSGEIF